MCDQAWEERIVNLVANFASAAAFAGYENAGVFIDSPVFLYPPYVRPTRLPDNKMALYIFRSNEERIVLKVGIDTTGQRISTPQYRGTQPGTLGLHLIEDEDFPLNTQDAVANYIQNECHCVHIFVNVNRGRPFLLLFEAFAHCVLHPKYEGRRISQDG